MEPQVGTMRRDPHVDRTKAVLQMLIGHLVEEPEAVVIRVASGQMSSLFEVQCARSDMGRLLGNRGRNAESIRTLVSSIGARRNREYKFQVVEPEGGRNHY